MELFHANKQWATRPADERFASLAQMHAATLGYAKSASEFRAPWSGVRVEAYKDDLIISRGNGAALVGNYAFGQIANRVGAPAAYLRTLAPTLAAQNLNYGLANNAPEGDAQLLIHSNGTKVLRAATSDTYTRIWNHEVIERLIDTSRAFDLVPAAPTFRQFGPNPDAPALYASDHDMFAFLMTRERAIQGPLGEQLFRGMIVINSEVGAAALKILTFLFREICGNHIIWGAVEVIEVKLVHRSGVRRNWIDAQARVRKYLDSSESFDTARFKQTLVEIAATKDDVLDTLFGKLRGQITRKALAASYDAVVPSEDGNPNTVWGMAQGVTRHSQTLPYADERTALDRAAGKLLELAF